MIKMEAEEYFAIMKETGVATYERVEEFLDDKIKEYHLNRFIKTFIDSRLENKSRLRSLLVRGVYEIVNGDKDWKRVLDVCAGFELWCIADYLTNDVFDDKLDKHSTMIEGDDNLFYIASAVVRELSGDILQKTVRKMRPEKETNVLRLFGELVMDAYMHQWVDYNSKYKDEKPEELESKIFELFGSRYIDYEAGNCFGKICRISAIIFGADDNQENSLADYGKKISTSLQIANDIADIADKGYDLKNKLKTYPLLLTFLKTGKNVYSLPLEEVRELFVKSGAFEESRKRAMEYGKKAKRAIKNLPKPNRDILSCMLILSVSNKYYKKLWRLK